MIDSSYLALLQNASLLLALALVFDTTTRIRRTTQTLWVKLLLGLIVGGIGIVVMNTPWIYGQGLIFDTRSILLSLSGLFFGAVPTTIAILMTALYRFSLGGAYVTGISVIFATGLIGIGWRHLRLSFREKKPLVKIKWWQLYLFGLVVHVVMLVLMLTQPSQISLPLLQSISVPILLIYPAVSLLLGMLMTNRLRRENVIEENRKSRERLASMIKVMQYAEIDTQSFLDFAMEEAVKLTESKMGFIFYYDEDSQKFTVSSWSKSTLEFCKIPEPQLVYELEKTGVWGEAVRQRKNLILNHYKSDNSLKKGYPEGHPDIERLLEVPIFSDNKIVAVVGMANKATDYDEFDAVQLSLLMEMIWKTEESKKAALALKRSEENYRFLFNQSADGIFISNQAGELEDVNTSGCEMLGYGCEEIKEHFYKLFSDAQEYYADEQPKPILQVGHNYLSERKFSTKNGKVIDLEILTQLLPDGRVQKIVRNISDRKIAEENARQAQLKLQGLLKTADEGRKALLSVIEDQKEIEDALRKSEQSYRNLFENITQGFAVHKIILNQENTPVDYMFVSVNPAFEKMTGLKSNDIVGKNAYSVLPDLEKKWLDVYAPVALTGTPVRFEDYSASLDKYYDVAAFSPEPGYFATIISDISERKKYEMQIRNFNVELENKVKERTAELETANHELESFSYSVSHDLRAPLRSINGFAQIITEEYMDQLDPELLRYFDLIRKNASMMGNLVDDLLNFSRLGRQSITCKSVITSKVVQEVIEFLQPEILLKKIRVQIGDLPDCEADPALLRQVFMNLISNAVKFTNRAASPQIEIGFQPNFKRGQDEVSCYFIKDNGVGFDMKFYDKLFGVFQRLHRAEDYEGTGVGLAIVHRIVEKHGGKVWAEAAIGQGATFYFTLGELEHGK